MYNYSWVEGNIPPSRRVEVANSESRPVWVGTENKDGGWCGQCSENTEKLHWNSGKDFHSHVQTPKESIFVDLKTDTLILPFWFVLCIHCPISISKVLFLLFVFLFPVTLLFPKSSVVLHFLQHKAKPHWYRGHL